MSPRDRLDRIKSGMADLIARLRVFLDTQAEKEKQAWGASMEYRRRYTNPDEAKRARTPPELKR
jgi:hypothetical protein